MFLVVLMSCLLLSVCAAAATALPPSDGAQPEAPVVTQNNFQPEVEAMAGNLDELNDEHWQALLRKWPPRSRFEAGWESKPNKSCFQRLGDNSLDDFDFGPFMDSLDQRILRMRRQSVRKFENTFGFSKIAFTYNKNGRIDAVFVCRTSGDQQLNEQAEALISSLPQMAPLPKDGPDEVRCYYSIYGNTASGGGSPDDASSGEAGHVSGRVLTDK